jgi:hypothetical protein
VKDVDAMYLAMESTVKREADRMAERIVAAFQESLAKENLSSKLQMTYTIIGFPEETAEEEAYLRKVVRQEGP